MKKIINALYIAIILILMYAPIFTLTLYSFVNSNVVSIEEIFNVGFSLELYKKLFSSATLMKIVFDTIMLALLVATLSTILGTLGAIGIFHSRGKLGKGVKAASRVPVINAEIVTAVALILMFTLVFSNSRSYFSLVIGHMVITAPFVVLSVLPKLKQMDPNMYEAALDLGATPLKAIWQVVIPELRTGIVSGFMLSVTLSLDDYIVSAYTQPAGFKTISTYVYGAINKSGVNSLLPALRALSAIIFIVILLVAILKNLVENKKKENK